MRIFRQSKKRPAFCISVKFFYILIFGFSFGIFSPAAFGESSNLSGGASPGASSTGAFFCVSPFISQSGEILENEKQAIILRAYEDLLKLAVSGVPPELASSLLRQLIQSPLNIRSPNVDENRSARSSVPDLSIHPAILATGLGPSLAQIQLILAELNMSEAVLPLLKEIAQNKLDSLNKTKQEVRKQKERKRNAKGFEVLSNTGRVNSFAISPDGKTLASGSRDGNIRILKFDETTEQWVFHSALMVSTFPINSVAFSPDGKTLVSGSDKANNFIWKLDETTGQWILHSNLTGVYSTVTSVAFSPDGETLIAGTWNGDVHIWKQEDVTSGWFHRIKRLLGKSTAIGQWSYFNTLKVFEEDYTSARIFSVAFSPDGKTLAFGFRTGIIQILKIDKSNTKWTLHSTLAGHSNWVDTVVAFSPDGKTLASGASDNTVRIWKLDEVTGQWAHHSTLAGHSSWVNTVAFSPDGKTLASGSADNTVRIWNLDETTSQWAHYSTLTGHADDIISVAFSPDGKTLASGSEDKTIRIWDLAKTFEALGL